MRPERKPWITALQGIAVAVASFAALGTVSAIWDNPFFIRMTPTDGWETGLLAMLSVLMGLYVMVRVPVCSSKSVTAGGILGFVGIACPVCNQILLLIFGGELLMTYFEPVRIYVAALGVVITAWAVWRAWQGRREMVVSLP